MYEKERDKILALLLDLSKDTIYSITKSTVHIESIVYSELSPDSIETVYVPEAV